MKNLYIAIEDKDKISEIKYVFPNIKKLRLSIPEIQENSAEKIIKNKISEISKKFEGLEIIVENTSLYLDALNGLPGPLMRWFLEKNSPNQIYNICEKIGAYNAKAKTIIGYKDRHGQTYFFDGELSGMIIKPRIETDLEWESIFRPCGYNKTLKEVEKKEKREISMRVIAARKLKDFIDNS